LARFVAEVSNELDLSAIYVEYERHDSRGLSAYYPLLLTRLLLYGYNVCVTSSRAIEKATYDSVRSGIWLPISIPITTPSPVSGSSI
jgi:transposase